MGATGSAPYAFAYPDPEDTREVSRVQILSLTGGTEGAVRLQGLGPAGEFFQMKPESFGDLWCAIPFREEGSLMVIERRRDCVTDALCVAARDSSPLPRGVVPPSRCRGAPPARNHSDPVLRLQGVPAGVLEGRDGVLRAWWAGPTQR